MRKVFKLLVWLVVLAGCAGVGAFIASRSNLFPPGVEVPGPLPTVTSPSESSAAFSWAGSAIVRSTHHLFVGGSCRTNWRVRMRVEVFEGIVTGTGSARLRGEPRCDFPTAQLQAQLIRLQVTGTSAYPMLQLQLSEPSLEPVGSIDLGGLVALLERLDPELQIDGERAIGSLDSEAPDGDRGTYSVRGVLILIRQD